MQLSFLFFNTNILCFKKLSFLQVVCSPFGLNNPLLSLPILSFSNQESILIEAVRAVIAYYGDVNPYVHY